MCEHEKLWGAPHERSVCMFTSAHLRVQWWRRGSVTATTAAQGRADTMVSDMGPFVGMTAKVSSPWVVAVDMRLESGRRSSPLLHLLRSSVRLKPLSTRLTSVTIPLVAVQNYRYGCGYGHDGYCFYPRDASLFHGVREKNAARHVPCFMPALQPRQPTTLLPPCDACRSS